MQEKGKNLLKKKNKSKNDLNLAFNSSRIIGENNYISGLYISI